MLFLANNDWRSLSRFRRLAGSRTDRVITPTAPLFLYVSDPFDSTDRYNPNDLTLESQLSVVLGLMAKFWTAGHVKTRLGQSIGMHHSARLHKLFVQVLTDNLASSADHRFAVVTPRAKAKRFASQISAQWSIAHQSEGDLGYRMMDWMQSALEKFDRVILIGADCPLIDAAEIKGAADRLLRHDVVIGPAIDGGYYLIGLKGPWNDRLAKLFVDMPWSSDQVLSTTLHRCQTNGLSVATLDEREDIDTAEALNRLRQELEVETDANLAGKRLGEQIESILNDLCSDKAGSNE